MLSSGDVYMLKDILPVFCDLLKVLVHLVTHIYDVLEALVVVLLKEATRPAMGMTKLLGWGEKGVNCHASAR